MQATTILMIPLLGVLAIVQSVVGPRLMIFGVRPDLVLLMVVAWSLFNGSYSGVMWAFVGGLWMDILSGGPMGGSSLALMAASLVTGIGHNRLFRNNLLVPLVAAVVATLIYSLVYLGMLAVVGHRLAFLETFVGLVLPAVLYNSALLLLLTPLLYRWLERRELDMLE